MVVEELCFGVDRGDREAFLAADERVWTSFLQTCDGFVGKEVWLDPARPDEVRVIVWWETLAHWHAVTRERVAAVDAAMGDLLRPATSVRALEVAQRSHGGGVR